MEDTEESDEYDGSHLVVGEPTPHDGQQDVLRSDARIRVVVKGRRWGGSELVVMDALAEAQAVEGHTVWVITPTMVDLRRLFDEFRRRTESAKWIDAKLRETPHQVLLTNGSTVELFRVADVHREMVRRLDIGNKPLPSYVAVDELDNIQEDKRGGVAELLDREEVKRQLLVGTPHGYKEVPEWSEYVESWLWREFEPGLETGTGGPDERMCWRFPTVTAPHIEQKYIDDLVDRWYEGGNRQIIERDYDARWDVRDGDWGVRENITTVDEARDSAQRFFDEEPEYIPMQVRNREQLHSDVGRLHKLRDEFRQKAGGRNCGPNERAAYQDAFEKLDAIVRGEPWVEDP